MKEKAELREKIARLDYERDPVFESGESLEGFTTSPGGNLSWGQFKDRCAEFGDDRLFHGWADKLTDHYGFADAILALSALQGGEGKDKGDAPSLRDDTEAEPGAALYLEGARPIAIPPGKFECPTCDWDQVHTHSTAPANPTPQDRGEMEAVARALCANDRCDPDDKFEGHPLWRQYEDEAEAAVKTLDAHRSTPPPAGAGGSGWRDALVKHMVDRFLWWRLPEDFHPDCGIHFDADEARKLNPRNMRYEPVGTNLFTATQAEAMFRCMIAAAPAPEGAPVDDGAPHTHSTGGQIAFDSSEGG